MTQKEKAKMLVNKFGNFTVQRVWQNKNYDAIECALIAVDEIINTLSLEPIRVNNKYQTPNYWQEVKQEIEKL
jgi:hypothetical protein